jgi:hypothetical protein
MDLIERCLAEQLPFDDKADVSDPALKPENVEVGDHGHVGRQLFRHSWFVDLSQELLPDVCEREGGFIVDETVGSELLQDKFARLVVAGDLGHQPGQVLDRANTRTTFDRGKDRLGFLPKLAVLFVDFELNPLLEVFSLVG